MEDRDLTHRDQLRAKENGMVRASAYGELRRARSLIAVSHEAEGREEGGERLTRRGRRQGN